MEGHEVIPITHNRILPFLGERVIVTRSLGIQSLIEIQWTYPFNRSPWSAGAVDQRRAGRHYPRSVGEFQAWFRADRDCLDHLEWLGWPTGFVCPACGRDRG